MTLISTTPDLAGGVAAELSAVLGRAGLTARLARLSAGTSRETYRVRAVAEEWSGTFVLQRERRGPARPRRGVDQPLRRAAPAFELAIGWLRAHRRPDVAKVLVHGDFRLGNLIIGPDGIRAVLDWELAHLGDPAEDLAWLCLKAWRFRGSGVVGGLGELADLRDAYEREGGRRVEPERLFWWQVFGTLKWGAICLRQARIHLSGESRSVELAAIGRRVCETEYDLVRMLP